MDILTKNDIKKLIEERDAYCISMYMPTIEKGSETEQNAIRFKNLIGKADSELEKLNFRTDIREAALRPARELIEDNDFWQHQSDGLAFFRSSDNVFYYRLPLDLEELAIVSNRFHIKPLLSLMRGDGHFYILSLNMNQIQLFQCTKQRISEVELSNAPDSLAEALKYDEPERQLQFHTGTGQKPGDRAAMHHGQGKSVGIDDAEQKKNIVRFFKQVDNGLTEFLPDHNAPLVIAGIDYLLPLYREANSYPKLMEEGISRNPDDLNEQELHKKALTVVEPYFKEAEKRATEKYLDLSGSNKTSDDVVEVVKEAHHQRIESLFVKSGEQVWGVFEKDTGEVKLHPESKVGDEDLLDLATAQTVMNGGSVYIVNPENMPGESELAAVYRN